MLFLSKFIYLPLKHFNFEREREVTTVKKILIFILTMVITLSLTLTPAFAAETDYAKVISEVNKANAEIDKVINKALEKVGKLDKEVYEPTSNIYIEIDKIIEELIKDTEMISAKTIEKAAKNGFIVVCDYVEVEIGGRVILIDPLRILDI